MDAKTSLLFAVDKSETERLNTTVQKASSPSRRCGFFTGCIVSKEPDKDLNSQLTEVERHNCANQQDSCHYDADETNRFRYPPFRTVEHFFIWLAGRFPSLLPAVLALSTNWVPSLSYPEPRNTIVSQKLRHSVFSLRRSKCYQIRLPL